MNSRVLNSTEKLHEALKQAVRLKEEKVRDNHSALITETLSDSQAAYELGVSAFRIAFSLAPGPVSKSIVSGLRVIAALPVISSLVAESRKDKKDLMILNKILSAYEQSDDEQILESTRLFVKLHSAQDEHDEGQFNISDVRLIYNQMPEHVLTLIENAKLEAGQERCWPKEISPRVIANLSRFALKSVFNAFSLAIKSCSVDAKNTVKIIGGALGDVKRLFTTDLKSVWDQARSHTLYEGKQRLYSDLYHAGNLGSDDLKSLFNPHVKLARSIHPLQDELRSNARMRIGTGVGILACSSFISLALINAGIALSVAAPGAALGYLGFSALLSVPPLRVLCERQQELRKLGEDKTLQILEHMSPA